MLNPFGCIGAQKSTGMGLPLALEDQNQRHASLLLALHVGLTDLNMALPAFTACSLSAKPSILLQALMLLNINIAEFGLQVARILMKEIQHSAKYIILIGSTQDCLQTPLSFFGLRQPLLEHFLANFLQAHTRLSTVPSFT